MRKTGYIRRNENDPEKIDQQKNVLTQAGCDEVIVERVSRVDGVGLIGTWNTRWGLLCWVQRRLMPRGSGALRFDTTHQQEEYLSIREAIGSAIRMRTQDLLVVSARL